MTLPSSSRGLPIKIDSTSNGEYRPIPVGRTIRQAQDLAVTRITDHARHTGRSRRGFLASLCGAATTLLTLKEAFAATGNVGGFFGLVPEAAFDPAAAVAQLAGDEFIFDVQTHMVDLEGAWRQRPGGERTAAGLARAVSWWCPEAEISCWGADRFVKEVFLDSDTQMAVLSFTPALPEDNPLTLEEAGRVRELVDALEGNRRLMFHAMVIPNQPPLQQQLDRMAAAHAQWGIAAWKVYTQWGPDGVGWWLDDPEVGIPFIEQARALGVKLICIHKGLSFGGMAAEYASCADVGRVARLYPDVTFLIYHSGFEPNNEEGPYNPAAPAAGVDTLLKSLDDNAIPPNANVYAELGSTWRILMSDPTAAAHVLGKLIKRMGEDRVLWGSDSLWYGSPQDQIQAFRAFRIAPALQEAHGYAELTPAIKAKIFGLSGAAVYGIDPAAVQRRAGLDRVGRMRAAYAEAPAPSFRTYGPRTLAEFEALQNSRGGLPT